MDDPSVFYLSVSDYRAQSAVPSLLPTEDAAVKSLLLETMVEIDAYIGGGWARLDDDQEFLFPRIQDTDDAGDASIPRCVAIATRKIADAKLQKADAGILPHEIATESNLGHSYQKNTQRTEVRRGFEHWPPEVFAILEPVAFAGGEFAVPDPYLQGVN